MRRSEVVAQSEMAVHFSGSPTTDSTKKIRRPPSRQGIEDGQKGGVIELGAMGQGVAKNLIEPGFEVRGCVVRAESVAAFGACGGNGCNASSQCGSSMRRGNQVARSRSFSKRRPSNCELAIPWQRYAESQRDLQDYVLYVRHKLDSGPDRQLKVRAALQGKRNLLVQIKG